MFSFYDSVEGKIFPIGINSSSKEELFNAVGEWLLEDPATHAILQEQEINPKLWLKDINLFDINLWFPELEIMEHTNENK